MILVHSYEKYHSGHDSWAFFAIAGLVFVTIAVLHHTGAQKAPWIDGVFFAIGGILPLVIAYDYYNMEKKGLPISYLIAGVIQLVVAFRSARMGIKKHKQAL